MIFKSFASCIINTGSENFYAQNDIIIKKTIDFDA